jgi:hypothetical protein
MLWWLVPAAEVIGWSGRRFKKQGAFCPYAGILSVRYCHCYGVQLEYRLRGCSQIHSIDTNSYLNILDCEWAPETTPLFQLASFPESASSSSLSTGVATYPPYSSSI